MNTVLFIGGPLDRQVFAVSERTDAWVVGAERAHVAYSIYHVGGGAYGFVGLPERVYSRVAPALGDDAGWVGRAVHDVLERGVVPETVRISRRDDDSLGTSFLVEGLVAP